MNSLGGFSMDNLPPFLQQMAQTYQNQQAASANTNTPLHATQGPSIGLNTYEINSKADIEYIEPDTSGRLQFLFCRSENRVYVGRYSYSKKEMDYEAFLSEGEVNLFKKNDSSDIATVVEALKVLASSMDGLSGTVTSKMDGIYSEVRELKAKKKPSAKEAAE